MAINADKLPFVSILVSLHHCEDTARASIDSCLAQQYRNVEVIVIDDCSKHSTSELARSYEPWVRLVRVPQNLGMSVGRNVGLSYAIGDFVLFPEPDDLLFPDRLRHDLEAARGPRADIVISVNRWFKHGETIRYDAGPICRRERRLLRHITSIAGTTEGALTSMLQYGAPPQSCILYRTSVVRALGGYVDDCIFYAERELLFRAICRGATVAVNPLVTSARRFHELPSVVTHAPRQDDLLQELALAKRYTFALERAGLMHHALLRQALIAYVIDRVYEYAKDVHPELADAALNVVAAIENDASACTTDAAARNSRPNQLHRTSHV